MRYMKPFKKTKTLVRQRNFHCEQNHFWHEKNREKNKALPELISN